MITRGYLIGQIIDELSTISEKIKFRSDLGLTDLNIYVEDFYKNILNITLDYKLKNLNEERSNAPGLDLGDKNNGVAFQITSTKSSAKVNKTLKKAATLLSDYPSIKILILREKQDTYSIDAKLAKPFNFVKGDIWDLSDVLNQVMFLDVSKLRELNDFINQEASRVKIELEIPNKKGEYQTNIAQYIESIPKERFSGISKYYDFLCSKEDDYNYTKDDIEFDFKGLIKKLKKLPRITRQFYAFMLERGEFSDVSKFINADYLARICSFPDMKGELRLLEQAELCSFITPDEYGESANYHIHFPSKVKNDYFVFEFQEYIKSESISLESVIVSLDFFDFD